MPFGMFIFGFVMSKLYGRWHKLCYVDKETRIIYVVVFITVASTGISADFTGMMSALLQKTIPILFVFKAIRSSN